MSFTKPRAYAGITSARAEQAARSFPDWSYREHCWLPVWMDLELIEEAAADHPRPGGVRWYGLLVNAFQAARSLVDIARQAKPVSGEVFAGAAARLDGLWQLFEVEREGVDLAGWPSNPGAVLMVYADACWAGVVVRFCETFYTELKIAGSREAWGVRYSDTPLLLADPWFEGYRDRFGAGCKARPFASAELWPTPAELDRACRSAGFELDAEFQAWSASAREVSAGPALLPEAGAGALTDALTPAALLPHVLAVGERLASMNAEWWSREHFKPAPDPDSSVVTIIDPEGEAAWHRQGEAKRQRDALRNQALRVCAACPGLPPPPATTQDAEGDITDGLARWCLDAMAGDGRAGVMRQAQDAGEDIEAAGLVAAAKAGTSGLTGEARALAVLAESPGLNMTEIAERAGVSRQTLYTYKRFQQARNIMRETGKAKYPKRSDTR